jgi:hypothetical protein
MVVSFLNTIGGEDGVGAISNHRKRFANLVAASIGRWCAESVHKDFHFMIGGLTHTWAGVESNRKAHWQLGKGSG